MKLVKAGRFGARGRPTTTAILAAIAVLVIFAVPAAHATKAPTATTGAASKVTIPAVTLNATVNPNGAVHGVMGTQVFGHV